MGWGLSVAAAISGALCVGGKYSHSRWMVFVFKPLTTVLVLAVAFAVGAFQTSYGHFVAVAIVLSLLGDVFLMLPKDRFVQGLLSFLAAHLALISAFTLEWSGVTWWLFIAIGLFATGMYAVLAPYLGRMKLAVTVYILVIGTMAWLGCERWLALGSISGLLAAVGSIFFLISDSTLALNRFRTKFRSADFLVLSTYWVSLWLIALSTRLAWM